MYKELYKDSIREEEAKLIKFWKDIDLLNKSTNQRKENKSFIFFEGPPTANGVPGLHHVLARGLKDGICRYKSMKGYFVERKAGWDTHGLPVEIEVEKELGIDNKQEIEAYGIDKFNKKCKESVFKYEKVWREQTEQMGYLIDLDNPYVTLENDYIESVWWILKKFYDKGLIYEGHKIIPYCSRCGTGLASHEVAQGYKMVKQETVIVAFKSKSRDEYFLAWTTTPWTLASNVMLAVNPKVVYARVKQDNNIFILAKSKINEVMGDDVEIVEEFLGETLEYEEYHQLMPFVDVDKKAFFVVLADYVTTDDGTGIVHSAPAFGEEDFNTGLKYDAPVIQPVSLEGKFTKTPWEGQFVMDADLQIVDWLRQKGHLYKKQRVEHNYPHCWRCDTPLLYYANPSYYIEMSKLREDLIKNNKTVKWHPDHVGEKRFGNWLENIRDWAISRSRYWGTPLNIWKCECGHEEAIGSIEELREKSIKELKDIELHRPYVDLIEIKCDKCGKSMKRVEYVVDVWFDSGSMPFAQWHYPFENKENFDRLFPADFICEGIDQTRGWFYTLMAISTFIMGKAPYKNVLVNDMLLDKDGKKMSKSRGTAVDAFDLFRDYGADAVRWYLSYSSPAWQPTKFNEEGLKEVNSKFFLTLKNIYHLLTLYANTDSLNIAKFKVDYNDRAALDRWIITRLNILIKEVDAAYSLYDLTSVTRLIQDFVVEDFSNWYIRRSRRRYWKSDLDIDKKSVFLTTYEVLINIVKLSAPIAPFITEKIYKNLTNKESVHLSDFPEFKQEYIDIKLDKQMIMAREIVKLGRAARESVSIKVRQPISRVLVDKDNKDLLDGVKDIILEELNAKEVVFVENVSEYVNFIIKPNFPVLGPILGKNMGDFQKLIRSMDQKEIGNKIRSGKTIDININDLKLNLNSSNIEIQVKAKDNYTVSTIDNLFCILDTKITNELEMEGLAREFISKLQQIRKNSGYDVSDRIIIEYNSTPKMIESIEEYKDYIMEELLADSITINDINSDTIKLNGHETKVSITRV